MKGIILAGGLGTRLRPLTLITNKHLLPVYNQPMILYPLATLQNSGINEIMIVSGKEYASHFMNFLGSGQSMGLKLSYAIQDKNDGGIADALKYAEDFGRGHHVAVILGDNIFEDNFAKEVKNFKAGTISFFKKVKDAHRFGAPVFDKSGKKIIKIEEKPEKPKSPYGQTGFYIFDSNVFNIIKTLKPSARGQLEIVDAVNDYIKRDQLQFSFVKGFWSDAGTFESLMEASTWLHKKDRKNHAKSE